MKSYTIYLIRHGLTNENREGKYIGHMDVPVCEDGMEMLKNAKEEMVFPYVEALFCSPLQRCQQTAKIYYPDMTPITIDGLKELNMGEFEGRTAEELKDNPVFQKWLAGEKGVEPPFGESNEAFGKRICENFEKIVEGLMKTGVTESAIITHGGVIMALLEAYGIPELPMHEWWTKNGHGYTLKINPSLWMRARKFEVFSRFPYEREELPD